MNYEVDYTYDYNDKNVPLSKSGDMTVTAGPNTGQRIQIGPQFSYY